MNRVHEPGTFIFSTIFTKKPASVRIRYGQNVIDTMPKVRFNLHKTNAGYTIRLVFRLPGHKFVYYPGFEVKKTDWNGKGMEVRKGGHHWQEVNAALARLKNEVERLYTVSLGSGESLSPTALKIHLDRFWKGKSVTGSPKTLTQFIRQLAKDRLASGEIKGASVQHLNSLAANLDEFRKDIRLDEVDLQLHKSFTAFLVGQGKAPNTIHLSIKKLKQVMSAAVDMGLTSNQAFRSSRFMARPQEVDSVYLTALEVEALEKLDLTGPGLSGQSKARDLFLIGVYTGMRYSDFSELEPADINTYGGVLMVRKRMKKTGRSIAVPINRRALAVLEKYGMKSPAMKAQPLNRYLKEVCQMAGIEDVVKIEQTRGAKVEVMLLPKWKLVSTHTARRTFATLEYLAAVRDGRPYDAIMDITGHKSRATFLKYVKVTAEEKAVAWAKSVG